MLSDTIQCSTSCMSNIKKHKWVSAKAKKSLEKSIVRHSVSYLTTKCKLLDMANRLSCTQIMTKFESKSSYMSMIHRVSVKTKYLDVFVYTGAQNGN